MATTSGSSLLLGRDYPEYGKIAVIRAGVAISAAISVGSDEKSPSHRYKHDPNVKNEDALCVVERSGRRAFAVADAHFGPEASHNLIHQVLVSLTKSIPESGDELLSLVRSLGEARPAQTASETTLAVAVHDQIVNTGFGVSVGDSTIMLVSRIGETQVLNRRNNAYVSSADVSSSLGLTRFEFVTSPGDMLLAFTDGVNECHYRHPATSIRESDISEVVSAAGFDHLRVVNDLGQLALKGVRGNPGGQDNVAIVAASIG